MNKAGMNSSGSYFISKF